MTYMFILKCALKLVPKKILYYDARSEKHQNDNDDDDDDNNNNNNFHLGPHRTIVSSCFFFLQCYVI